MLDAILVPIAHDTTELIKAIGFAARLGCVLVAFCSQRASAAEAIRLAEGSGAELVAIDIDGMPADLLPAFATTDVLREAGFAYPKDTSAKRNLGLVFARFAGWERVVFLDDDIHLPDPDDLERAAQLLGHYEAVGLEIGDFPDNSVVCHAHRETGGEQFTFIGGGALAVGRESMSSFLDQDEGLAGATAAYWREFLGHRHRFIGEIIARVDPANPRAARIIGVLEAARRECERITPSLCVDYLAAWQQDRQRWREHVETVLLDHASGIGRHPGGTRVEKVLSELGLMECAGYLRRGE